MVLYSLLLNLSLVLASVWRAQAEFAHTELLGWSNFLVTLGFLMGRHENQSKFLAVEPKRM